MHVSFLLAALVRPFNDSAAPLNAAGLIVIKQAWVSCDRDFLRPTSSVT